MTGNIGNPEVESFLKRVRSGQFEVDSTHSNAEAYQMALATYNMDKRATGMSSPHTSDYMKAAIDMALSQGVIKPNIGYLEKLAKEIKYKKIKEQDIDRVEGSSIEQKKTIKVIILNKLGDKALNQLVAEISSLIKNNGMSIVSFLSKVIENSTNLLEEREREHKCL
jgi:hypothetical protein